MDTVSKDKMENEKKRLSIVSVFAVAVIFVCAKVFLINYDIAYDDNTNGGFIPPSFAVVFYYFVIILFFLIIAAIVKVCFRNYVRFVVLILISIILPIACYHVNYHTLKKEGVLHFLVDEGGIFHFLAIGDYNFDGMNDEEYSRRYEERTHSSHYGADLDDTIIRYVELDVTGTGWSLQSCFAKSEAGENKISFHIIKDEVNIKKAVLEIAFDDPNMAEKAKFYIITFNGQHIPAEQILKDEGVVKLTLNGEIFAEYQKLSNKVYIEIPIEYVIEDQ